MSNLTLLGSVARQVQVPVGLARCYAQKSLNLGFLRIQAPSMGIYDHHLSMP
jgi:hypothetical protein